MTSMKLHVLRRSSIAIAIAIAMLAGRAGSAQAAGVTPAKATPVQREQAQSRFLKGRELYNAKKYDAALIELTASLDIVASPNTRLAVGRCLRDMGRTVAAYEALGRAAVEAKELQHEDSRYEKAGEAATEERSKLLPKLGFVEVRVTHAGEATTVKVAGEEVRRGGWDEPVPVVPGTATILVETPGKPAIQQEVTVAAGQHAQVAIDAKAEAMPAAPPRDEHPVDASSPRSAMRPIAYATAGVAAAGLVTFFVAGALANGTYSDLEAACGSGPCARGHEGDIEAGRTQQTVANVGLVVFAVAGAATVTLFVLSAPKKDAPASAPPAASARVTAGPTFVGLQGGF